MFGDTTVQQAIDAWKDINSKSFKTTHKTLYTTVKTLTTFLPLTAGPARRMYHVSHNLSNIPTCSVCLGKPCSWNNTKKTYSSVCSKHCSRASGEFDKRKATCVNKYGHENPRKSADVKHKIRLSMITKYGVDNYFKSGEFAASRRRLLGDVRTNVSQLHIHTDNIKLLDSKDWCIDQHIVQQKSITQISTELGYSDVACISNKFKSHGIVIQNYFRSIAENEIAEFITGELGISVIRGCRTLLRSNQEIDVYIPSHNLAIEFCGLFWHNELTKDRNYHRSKYTQCLDQKIQLLTIFEDEWHTKSELIKSMISHKLNKSIKTVVAGRKCEIIPLAHKEKQAFFNRTHIQGDGPSSVAYGLVDGEGTLVAAASFAAKGNWLYLVRYSSDAIVQGGMSKLVKGATRTLNINNVYTFADNRWSTGQSYIDIGFNVDKELPPDYQYIVNKERRHKFAFRHKHLRNKLKYYDPLKSEVQNCHANKIYRIWDCGKTRFVLKA